MQIPRMVYILAGEAQVLVKQVDFVSDDKNKCSAFIVTDVTSMLPEVSQFLKDILVAVIVILVITGALLGCLDLQRNQDSACEDAEGDEEY